MPVAAGYYLSMKNVLFLSVVGFLVGWMARQAVVNAHDRADLTVDLRAPVKVAATGE